MLRFLSPYKPRDLKLSFLLFIYLFIHFEEQGQSITKKLKIITKIFYSAYSQVSFIKIFKHT